MLIPQTLYRSIGGYPDQPLMEDVALALLLKGKLTGLDATAVTSADRYRHSGWIKRGARNLWTLTRYLAGATPAKLAADYSK